MKPKTLIVRIQLANGRHLKPIESTKADGWTKGQVEKFVNGIKLAYPDALHIKITTSTIT